MSDSVIDNKRDFRILIIDDNTEIHNDFIKILVGNHSLDENELDSISNKLFHDEKSNLPIVFPEFKIDTATQGQQGVNKISTAIKEGRPYSLAFVDVRMPPGWDGIETIKHIWEIDKDIQIVICTAYSDYSWEETISELGQTDNLLILKKPFDIVAVRQLACALTRKWQLMQEARTHTDSLEHTILERTEELHLQATHDALTGLPNRVLLYDRMKEALQQAEINHTGFAILFFDLDRFKLINDSLNHFAGDEFLSVMSNRLLEKLAAADLLARLGGDEFVLVLNEVKSPDQILEVANLLLETISQPLHVAGHDICISTSIGISVYPKDGSKIEELLRNADTAMYRAKKSGGNQFQFYTEEMSIDCLKSFELESDLRRAVAANELFLRYQPQFDMQSNTIVGVEALIRWNHPQNGVILPMAFIPIAEQTGLIIPIGEWVLREACAQNKRWQDAGLPKMRIAVNVSTQQIKQFNFVDMVSSILKETMLAPEYLEIELTENTIIADLSTLDTINSLKKIGVQISVDDFGTGYSSLSYLRNIPLDRLKIDQSFIKNILVNRGDEVIIRAIIAMASGLNLEILAEGVETQKQLDFLKTEECNKIQGFYFSKPLMPKELEALLKDKNKIAQLLSQQTEKSK